MCYKKNYNKKQKCKLELSFKNFYFGLFSETRKYKTGIVSNRKSACYGECVTKFSTNCPSRS